MPRLRSSITLSALALAACSGGAADDDESTSTAAVASQTVEIARTGNGCADVASGTLVLEPCNASSGQSFLRTGSELVGPGGKCLQPSTNANHATVVLATCSGASAQTWTVKGGELVNGGGRCLDLRSGNTANGTTVQIYDCYDNANQQWTLKSLTQPGNHKVKWNPGHYMGSDTIIRHGQTAAKVANELSELKGESGIVGYRALIGRYLLEPSKGKYDFTVIDDLLTAMRATNPPKHLVVVTMPGDSWTDVPALYRQAEMDDFIALTKALGARYDGNPEFEAIMYQEDSFMVSTWLAQKATYPDFNTRSSALEDQLKRLLSAATAAFPHTSVIEENTWLSTEGPTEEFEAWMVANRVAPGTADTHGLSKFVNGWKDAWGLNSLMGVSGGGYTATDLRPKARAMLDVEGADLVLSQFGTAPDRVKDICQALNQKYWASHAFWNHLATNEPVFGQATPAAVAWPNLVKTLATTADCKLVHVDYPPNYP
jgi:hypothetical protein